MQLLKSTFLRSTRKLRFMLTEKEKEGKGGNNQMVVITECLSLANDLYNIIFLITVCSLLRNVHHNGMFVKPNYFYY